MNTLTEQFDSVYADTEEPIVEPKNLPKVPVITPVSELQVIKPLRGYESTMRKHAAACEAGR